MPKDIEDKRRQALLEGIKRSRSRFESLQDEIEDAKSDYYEDIRALHRAGMSTREVAEHVGLSHQRVHQIINGERAARTRKVRKGLGAAGVVAALALASAAYLQSDDLPRPKTERVTLIQEQPLTRNDIANILRFEKPIAQGRRGGKRWRYLVSYLGGNYCVRFRWSPGPRHQGLHCRAVPERYTLRGQVTMDEVAFGVDPVQRGEDTNPVPFATAEIPALGVSEVAFIPCGGEAVEGEVVPETEIGITFVYTFLPRGTESTEMTFRDPRTAELISSTDRCPQ